MLFAKGIAKEFKATYVTINTIISGFVETPCQNEKLVEIIQNINYKTVIHRFTTVSELENAFLLCIDNPFVNGSLIEVNGSYVYK